MGFDLIFIFGISSLYICTFFILNETFKFYIYFIDGLKFARVPFLHFL
jgi:hypothetical protein